MRDKEGLKKELAGIGPLLGRLKERPSGYRVPEGYFEELREKVLSAVAEKEPSEAAEGERRSSFRMLLVLRPVLAYAAALALVLGGWYAFSRQEKPTECTELSCLSSEELNAFIELHIEQFDTGTILAAGDVTALDIGFEVGGDTEESSELLLQAVQALGEQEIEALLD